MFLAIGKYKQRKRKCLVPAKSVDLKSGLRRAIGPGALSHFAIALKFEVCQIRVRANVTVILKIFLL